MESCFNGGRNTCSCQVLVGKGSGYYHVLGCFSIIIYPTCPWAQRGLVWLRGKK